MGVVSTPPVEGVLDMLTFSLWMPIPHHYVFIRMDEGPLMTRAERFVYRTNAFIRATQPGWVVKWYELFGESIDNDWDQNAPGNNEIGGGNIVVIMPPGGPLEAAIDEGDEAALEFMDGGELLVSSFSSEDGDGDIEE